MIAKRTPHRTRVGKRNQVTIPVALLRELGIGPGDQVEVSLDTDRTIGIAKADDPFERLAALRAEFKRAHPEIAPAPASDEEFEAMIRTARVERSERAYQKDQRILRESRELNR